MKQEDLNIYTDYLSVSFGHAPTTGLSKMLEGEVSHDQITRMLSEEEQGSKELWKKTKSTDESYGSTGFLYLACSQLDADWNKITTTYQKRWNVELFHKSLKSNAALNKSPARRVNAQLNHIFASILAVFNMEKLKIKSKLNHFALRSKLYLKAIQSAFNELQVFKQNRQTA